MGERDGVEVIEDIEPFCLVAREIFPSAFDDFEGVESIVDADALLQGGDRQALMTLSNVTQESEFVLIPGFTRLHQQKLDVVWKSSKFE